MRPTDPIGKQSTASQGRSLRWPAATVAPASLVFSPRA
jgi:hypothetical protein